MNDERSIISTIFDFCNGKLWYHSKCLFWQSFGRWYDSITRCFATLRSKGVARGEQSRSINLLVEKFFDFKQKSLYFMATHWLGRKDCVRQYHSFGASSISFAFFLYFGVECIGGGSSPYVCLSQNRPPWTPPAHRCWSGVEMKKITTSIDWLMALI